LTGNEAANKTQVEKFQLSDTNIDDETVILETTQEVSGGLATTSKVNKVKRIN